MCNRGGAVTGDRGGAMTAAVAAAVAFGCHNRREHCCGNDWVENYLQLKVDK